MISCITAKIDTKQKTTTGLSTRYLSVWNRYKTRNNYRTRYLSDWLTVWNGNWLKKTIQIDHWTNFRTQYLNCKGWRSHMYDVIFVVLKLPTVYIIKYMYSYKYFLKYFLIECVHKNYYHLLALPVISSFHHFIFIFLSTVFVLSSVCPSQKLVSATPTTI